MDTELKETAESQQAVVFREQEPDLDGSCEELRLERWSQACTQRLQDLEAAACQRLNDNLELTFRRLQDDVVGAILRKLDQHNIGHSAQRLADDVSSSGNGPSNGLADTYVDIAEAEEDGGSESVFSVEEGVSSGASGDLETRRRFVPCTEGPTLVFEQPNQAAPLSSADQELRQEIEELRLQLQQQQEQQKQSEQQHHEQQHGLGRVDVRLDELSSRLCDMDARVQELRQQGELRGKAGEGAANETASGAPTLPCTGAANKEGATVGHCGIETSNEESSKGSLTMSAIVVLQDEVARLSRAMESASQNTEEMAKTGCEAVCRMQKRVVDELAQLAQIKELADANVDTKLRAELTSRISEVAVRLASCEARASLLENRLGVELQQLANKLGVQLDRRPPASAEAKTDRKIPPLDTPSSGAASPQMPTPAEQLASADSVPVETDAVSCVDPCDGTSPLDISTVTLTGVAIDLGPVEVEANVSSKACHGSIGLRHPNGGACSAPGTPAAPRQYARVANAATAASFTARPHPGAQRRLVGPPDACGADLLLGAATGPAAAALDITRWPTAIEPQVQEVPPRDRRPAPSPVVPAGVASSGVPGRGSVGPPLPVQVRTQTEAIADAWACSARAMSRGPMLITSGHGSLSARSSALGGSLAAVAAGAAAAADAQPAPPVLPAPLLAHSVEAPCGRSTPATAISSRASSVAEVKQQQQQQQHYQPTSSSRSSDSDPGVQPQQDLTAPERLSRLRHRSPDGRFVWAELAEKRTLVRTTQSPVRGQVQAELPNTARGLAGTAPGAPQHRANGSNTSPTEMPGTGRCCCVSPGRRSAPATTPTAPSGVATAGLPVLLGTQWTANPGVAGSSHSSYTRPAQQGGCIPRPRQGGSAGCITSGRGSGTVDPVLAGPSPRAR